MGRISSFSIVFTSNQSIVTLRLRPKFSCWLFTRKYDRHVMCIDTDFDKPGLNNIDNEVYVILQVSL